MANGHPNAMDYPVGWLQDEAVLVRQRITRQDANTAIWLHTAVNACLGKPGQTAFNKKLKEVEDG